MINLVSTSDIIRVITGSAADVEPHVSFADNDSSLPVDDPDRIVMGRTNTASITTATTTTVLGSPGSATIARKMKFANFHNNHASQATQLRVEHFDGTTAEVLRNINLLAGETLEYMEGSGWTHYDLNGGIYGASLILYDPRITTKVLLSDQSNSTVTPTNVTGIEVAMGVGTWVWQYTVRYQAAATTTGVRFDVNHDGTVTTHVWNQSWVGSLNTTSSDAPDQDMIAALGGVMSAFASRAKGTAGRGTTLSVDAANSDMLCTIEGITVVTVAGNLELWHGSEVAAASTVKAGTGLVAIKVG